MAVQAQDATLSLSFLSLQQRMHCRHVACDRLQTTLPNQVSYDPLLFRNDQTVLMILIFINKCRRRQFQHVDSHETVIKNIFYLFTKHEIQTFSSNFYHPYSFLEQIMLFHTFLSYT